VISYEGAPRFNALLFWKNTSHKAPRDSWFVSYLAISPVEVKSLDGVDLELSVYPAPIMVHEPILQDDLDAVKRRAVERSATLVDCGQMERHDMADKLREAIEEYLKDYLSHRYKMCRGEDKLKEVDIGLDLQNLEADLSREEKERKLDNLLSLTEQVRLLLRQDPNGPEFHRAMADIWANSPGSQFDMGLFTSIVSSPGPIADRIVEFYVREFSAMRTDDAATVDQCGEKIRTLMQLKRLEDSKRMVRQRVVSGDRRGAFEVLKEAYKVKDEMPIFCSDDELKSFAKLLLKDGKEYDELADLYIRKYLMIISEDYENAQSLHNEIRQMEHTLPA